MSVCNEANNTTRVLVVTTKGKENSPTCLIDTMSFVGGFGCDPSLRAHEKDVF
jgi:hypothetical protein